MPRIRIVIIFVVELNFGGEFVGGGAKILQIIEFSMGKLKSNV